MTFSKSTFLAAFSAISVFGVDPGTPVDQLKDWNKLHAEAILEIEQLPEDDKIVFRKQLEAELTSWRESVKKSITKKVDELHEWPTDVQDERKLITVLENWKVGYSKIEILLPHLPPSSDIMKTYISKAKEKWDSDVKKSTGKKPDEYLEELHYKISFMDRIDALNKFTFKVINSLSRDHPEANRGSLSHLKDWNKAYEFSVKFIEDNLVTKLIKENAESKLIEAEGSLEKKLARKLGVGSREEALTYLERKLAELESYKEWKKTADIDKIAEKKRRDQLRKYRNQELHVFLKVQEFRRPSSKEGFTYIYHDKGYNSKALGRKTDLIVYWGYKPAITRKHYLQGGSGPRPFVLVPVKAASHLVTGFDFR